MKLNSAATDAALLRPETRLVLGAGISAHTPDELADLSRIDWRLLITYADRERATLPLWRALKASSADLSGEGPRLLQRMAQIWEFRMLNLERLLHSLIPALQEAGIEGLLLKGAAAAATVYGGFGRRPMLDIDLLVPAEQADNAWRVAQSAGWKWDEASYPLGSYETAHHLPPLEDRFGASCGLEIHRSIWRPGHPFRLDEQHFVSNSRTVEINGSSCRVPRVSDQLLHCCIHFAWSHELSSHVWRTFSDVTAFLQSEDLDWDIFLSDAQGFGAATCCYWTFRLLSVVNGVSVPSEVLAQLRPSLPQSVLDRLERHYLLSLAPIDGAPSVELSKALWRLGLRLGPSLEDIELPGAPEPMGLRTRLAHHTRQLPAWFAYLKRLA